MRGQDFDWYVRPAHCTPNCPNHRNERSRIWATTFDFEITAKWRQIQQALYWAVLGSRGCAFDRCKFWPTNSILGSQIWLLRLNEERVAVAISTGMFCAPGGRVYMGIEDREFRQLGGIWGQLKTHSRIATPQYNAIVSLHVDRYLDIKYPIFDLHTPQRSRIVWAQSISLQQRNRHRLVTVARDRAYA